MPKKKKKIKILTFEVYAFGLEKIIFISEKNKYSRSDNDVDEDLYLSGFQNISS